MIESENAPCLICQKAILTGDKCVLTYTETGKPATRSYGLLTEHGFSANRTVIITESLSVDEKRQLKHLLHARKGIPSLSELSTPPNNAPIDIRNWYPSAIKERKSVIKDILCHETCFDGLSFEDQYFTLFDKSI